MKPFDADQLLAAVPGLRLLNDPDSLLDYGRDWTRMHQPSPVAVALPDSVEQIQAIVCHARSINLALVPSGGRTGMSGGAVAAAGELVVSMDRLNQIGEFDPLERIVTVQAGVVTQCLQKFANEQGLFFPIDFASSGSSQLGGNLATNAGGIRVLRYGLMRDWVVGLKVVTTSTMAGVFAARASFSAGSSSPGPSTRIPSPPQAVAISAKLGLSNSQP